MVEIKFKDGLEDKNYAHNNNFDFQKYADGFKTEISNLEFYESQQYGKTITISVNVPDTNLTISKMLNIQKIYNDPPEPLGSKSQAGMLFHGFGINSTKLIETLIGKKIIIIPFLQMDKNDNYRKDEDGNIYITYKIKTLVTDEQQKNIETSIRKDVCKICKKYIALTENEKDDSRIKLEHLESNCLKHLFGGGEV